MKKQIEDKIYENLQKYKILFKKVIENNTLKADKENLKIKNEELKVIIKEELYKAFMDKLESPKKLQEYKDLIIRRTSQRDFAREDNLKLKEELKSKEEKYKDFDKIVKKNERLTKQVKVLKEIIKEGLR